MRTVAEALHEVSAQSHPMEPFSRHMFVLSSQGLREVKLASNDGGRDSTEKRDPLHRMYLVRGRGEVTLGGPRDNIPARGSMRSYLAYRGSAKLWSFKRILNFCMMPHSPSSDEAQPSPRPCLACIPSNARQNGLHHLLHVRFNAARPPQRKPRCGTARPPSTRLSSSFFFGRQLRQRPANSFSPRRPRARHPPRLRQT